LRFQEHQIARKPKFQILAKARSWYISNNSRLVRPVLTEDANLRVRIPQL
jgi:hypothetical protein